MPTLENKLPEVDGRSLSRRAARSGVVLSLARASLPGQMVLRLRRIAADLGDLACDESAPAPDRIAAARAVVSVQEQLIDLLGIPKRPAAGNGRGKSSVPIDISPAAVVHTLPDLPA